MDPVSVLFSVYLNSVINSTDPETTATMGTELQSLVIQYQGVDVPFDYQLWQIQDSSVCHRYRGDINAFSKCTVLAKDLFQSLCTELGKSDKEHWQFDKTKAMYCEAGDSYEPTVAKVTLSGDSDLDDVQLARQKCSAAVIKAMDSREPSVMAERKAACEAYEKLKD